MMQPRSLRHRGRLRRSKFAATNKWKPYVTPFRLLLAIAHSRHDAVTDSSIGLEIQVFPPLKHSDPFFADLGSDFIVQKCFPNHDVALRVRDSTQYLEQVETYNANIRTPGEQVSAPHLRYGADEDVIMIAPT